MTDHSSAGKVIPFNEYPDRTDLAAALAGDVASALAEAIEVRGVASLVVSGGSTPGPMFKALSRHEIDWSRVSVTLADERAVPADHEVSNERLVREFLLQGRAAAAHFVALHEPEFATGSSAGTDARGAAVARVESRLAQLAHPFDVLLLGMGDDGHTASLFPDAPELEAAMAMDSRHSVLLINPPSQPLPRITLTRPTLLDARRVWLHITGEPKRVLYERVMKDGALPIARVLDAASAGCETAVYWAA